MGRGLASVSALGSPIGLPPHRSEHSGHRGLSNRACPRLPKGGIYTPRVVTVGRSSTILTLSCADYATPPAGRNARTASIVSASAALLSGRYAFTRANLSATPPG